MWKQLAAGLIASGIYLLDGLDEGFSSNILHQKKINSFPFEIDDVGLSWIASAMIISMPIGSICSGPLMHKFGRKKLLSTTCFLSLLGWILILKAQSILMLCVGRYLSGFAVGMEITAMIYVSEIAGNPHYRGFLLSLGGPVVGLGTTISFVLGSYLSEQLYCICVCSISLLFFGLTFFVPESPVWLMQNDDPLAAAKSLEWLQRTRDDVEKNDKDKDTIKFAETLNSLPLLTRIIVTKAWKPYLNLTLSFVLQNLSGFPVVVFYTANIYQSLNAPVDPCTSAIILVVIQTLSYCFLTMFLNKLDRRTWCKISSVGMFLCYTIIAVHEVLFSGADPEPLNWLPTICFWISSVFGCIGMYTVDWIQIGEVFPQSVKDFMGAFQLMTVFIMQFVSIKTYPLVAPIIGIHGVFTIFSLASLASIFYSQFGMVETRGKSFEEIEKMWLENNCRPTKVDKTNCLSEQY